MSTETISPYYRPGSNDRIAIGSYMVARRLSRAPLSTGRDRGCFVHREYETGRLSWHERCRTGGCHVHGYVSETWAEEVSR